MNRLCKLDRDNLHLEIELHRQISHPHIIRFYDSVQIANDVYLLLELASRNSLFFYIHTEEGLPEHLALRFVYQTALALAYLHDLNIIHRDIKPENILLTDDFQTKVCDFGWSCKLASSGDLRTSVCGTYEYMSPEIVNQTRHSSKTDVWCLGILLFELLTGNPPHKAHSLAQMRYQQTSVPIRLDRNFSPTTRDLMGKMLHPDAAQRINVRQVLAHPALAHRVAEFALPIKPPDIDILIRNYKVNTNQHIAELIAQIDALIYKGSYRDQLEQTEDVRYDYPAGARPADAGRGV